MSITYERVKRYRSELRDELANAEETLGDALDDTSCLSAEDIAELRANVEKAKKALEG